MTYIAAHSNAGSLTHWPRPGIECASSWVLVGFVTTEPHLELLQICFKSSMMEQDKKSPSNPKQLCSETFWKIIINLMSQHTQIIFILPSYKDPLWGTHSRYYLSQFEMRKLKSMFNWLEHIYAFSSWRVSLRSRPAFLKFQMSFFYNLDHVWWQTSILRLKKKAFLKCSYFLWFLPFDIKW